MTKMKMKKMKKRMKKMKMKVLLPYARLDANTN